MSHLLVVSSWSWYFPSLCWPVQMLAPLSWLILTLFEFVSLDCLFFSLRFYTFWVSSFIFPPELLICQLLPFEQLYLSFFPYLAGLHCILSHITRLFSVKLSQGHTALMFPDRHWITDIEVMLQQEVSKIFECAMRSQCSCGSPVEHVSTFNSLMWLLNSNSNPKMRPIASQTKESENLLTSALIES